MGLCVAVALAVTGCGGEPSLTEYVEQVNAAIDEGMGRYEVVLASPQGQVLVAEGEELYEFTPQDLQLGLEQLAEIQDEIMAIVNDIEPPEQVAELHALFFRTLPVGELAARAGTAATWEELSESSEMAAYRDALVADQQTCAEFQTKLDATEQRGVFEDTPWIPGEFKEIVDATIGCGVLPDNPQDMYRPPPAP
jgi:hypothetical protein